MKYEVGDRVKIKSLDWYNENKDTDGKVWTSGGQIPFDKCMSEWCGKVMTISHVRVDHYTMVEDLVGYWSDEMIEGLIKEETQQKFKVGDRVITNKGYIGKFEGWVSDYRVKVLFEESGCDVVIHPKDLKLMEEETKSNVIEETKNYWDSIKDAWICPEGYIFKDENSNVINTQKIIMEKKKNEYPKTYEECCNMKPTLQELIKLYNNTESRIEKANLWSHIEEWVEIFAENKYPNEYETSLHYDEEYEDLLNTQREAFKKGYLSAMEDLVLDLWQH